MLLKYNFSRMGIFSVMVHLIRFEYCRKLRSNWSKCDGKVMILTGSHEIDVEGGHIAGKGIASNVEIEDGCWLGARSMVLPGVTIAKKNILAAGSVMTTSSEIEKSLWAGVPAKMKKQY
jgi:maltose O-acetyltransferase